MSMEVFDYVDLLEIPNISTELVGGGVSARVSPPRSLAGEPLSDWCCDERTN